SHSLVMPCTLAASGSISRCGSIYTWYWRPVSLRSITSTQPISIMRCPSPIPVVSVSNTTCLMHLPLLHRGWPEYQPVHFQRGRHALLPSAIRPDDAGIVHPAVAINPDF